MRRFQLWADDDETAGTWIDGMTVPSLLLARTFKMWQCMLMCSDCSESTPRVSRGSQPHSSPPIPTCGNFGIEEAERCCMDSLISIKRRGVDGVVG